MYALKQFFIQYSHFFSGTALAQLLGILSFPILTRVLTVEQYGILGLVNTTMLLAVSLAKAGLSEGIIRFHSNCSQTHEKRTLFASTVLIGGLSLSILASVSYFLIFPVFAKKLDIKPEFIFCFMVMTIYIFIRPLNIIVLNFLRVNNKTLFINILKLVTKSLSIGLSLIFLIFIFKTLYGFFFGIILAEIIASVVLFKWFFKNYNINFTLVSHNLGFKLLVFGGPLLFNELAYLLLSYADRYLIIVFLGESFLGLYSVGYNLAMYVANIITFSLTYAIVPIYVNIYEKENNQKTEEFLERCTHYLIIGIIPICMGYFILSKDLFITLASLKYTSAANFSYIILLGTLMLGMNNILNAGLYLRKKTTIILIIMLVAVFTNILMNLVFIPLYGIKGAAVSTLFSCLISSILTVFFSYRYLIVRIDIRMVFYCLFLSAIMSFVINEIETNISWINLITKILLGIIIYSIGILVKERKNLIEIKEFLRSKNQV